MSNINIFIIIVLILSYETSGKHLHLSGIENDPLKNNIIRLQFWLDAAEQKEAKSSIVVLERNPVELYHAFETAGFDAYETSFDSFIEYIAHERSIPLKIFLRYSFVLQFV
jgi:hypothetical protein